MSELKIVIVVLRNVATVASSIVRRVAVKVRLVENGIGLVVDGQSGVDEAEGLGLRDETWR